MTRSDRAEPGSASASTAGNEYSIAPITMATDEADPLDRLARIVASTVARQGVRRPPRPDADGDVRGGAWAA